MIIDKFLLEEYPFVGTFYEKRIDESLPLDQREEVEAFVLETPCDIQESSKSAASGNITATFNVYFPFNKDEGVKVKRGMIFRGTVYDLEVNGEVVGVSPSQLGGCACYIKDYDV